MLLEFLIIAGVFRGVGGGGGARPTPFVWGFAPRLQGCCSCYGYLFLSFRDPINQFINVKARDEVALHIRARGLCLKRLTISRNNLTYKNNQRN